MDEPDLIERYREMAAGGQQFFGLSVLQHKKILGKLMKRHDAHSVLDYGLGLGDAYASPHYLHRDWGMKRKQVTLYDPAFLRFANKPESLFDAVLCSDVLEHVPEERVEDTLRELVAYSTKFVWASVCCRPARKTFPGTNINLHVTVKPLEWWMERVQLAKGAREFYLIETP